MGLYDIKVIDNQNKEVKLDEYNGKVLLIVNTATGCGFTPQYKGLQALYEKYKDRGFEVLDFPCNQFLGQAPGDDLEIENFCTVNYNTTFKRFKKVDVNGKNAEPLFDYLKSACANDVENEDTENLVEKLKSKLLYTMGSSIKWNFTKFLVDREGKVVKRFSPTIKPEDIEAYIEKYL